MDIIIELAQGFKADFLQRIELNSRSTLLLNSNVIPLVFHVYASILLMHFFCL